MNISQLRGVPAPGWQGRIQEGAYTSPSGRRTVFKFGALSRTTPLRRAEFEFNDLNDAYIQDNGFGARRYPLVCLFQGTNHDQEATLFEASLLERGVGRLEHPLYGSFQAIPVGEITRRNDLLDDANQTVIETTFSTTLASVYPSAEGTSTSEIEAQIAAFNAAAAGDFEEAMGGLNTIEKANLKATIRSMLREVAKAFAEASGAVSNARRQIQEQADLLNESLDTLVGAPLLLAQQVINFIQAPARILAGLASRFDGYAIMLGRLVAQYESGNNGPGAVAIESAVRQKKQTFRATDLFILGSVSGVVLSTLDQKFTTRPEAIRGAERALDQLGTSVIWRDAQLEPTGEIDSGASYQAAQKATASAAGFLLDTSFSLSPERAIVTDRIRTPLDVCAELYRSVDNATLDLLINSNDLGGDEILEIPRGRRLVYYA